MAFVPSYAVLVIVQAALVLAPGRPRNLWSSRVLGLAIPAAALVVGVVLAQVGGGADFLAALAAFATPTLAAAAGWARGWALPWLPVLVVPPLYALAWLRPDHLDGDAAAVLLIAGACLAVTGVVSSIAPRSWLVAGLVLLVVLDVILVWGDRQVEPTMNALQAAAPPTIGRQLPSLQQIDFGDASMGWLDFAAPALLGLLVARRFLAAVATGLTAGAWGLLLLATSPIAATPPVLAGLLAGRPQLTKARRTGKSSTRSGSGRPWRSRNARNGPSLKDANASREGQVSMMTMPRVRAETQMEAHVLSRHLRNRRLVAPKQLLRIALKSPDRRVHQILAQCVRTYGIVKPSSRK